MQCNLRYRRIIFGTNRKKRKHTHEKKSVNVSKIEDDVEFVDGVHRMSVDQKWKIN